MRVGGAVRRGHRNPELDVFASKPEVLRHDADDGANVGAESYRLPDGARIPGEQALPQAVRQHHHGFGTHPVFFRRKPAADEGSHAEEPEHTRTHLSTGHALRVFSPPERERGPVRRGKRLKDPRVVPPVFEGRIRCRSFLPAGNFRRLMDGQQTVGLRIGKRTQIDGVHHGEHRRGCADAQRQRQQRDGREPRRSPQPPDCISRVLHESLHVHPPCEDGSQSQRLVPPSAQPGPYVPSAQANGLVPVPQLQRGDTSRLALLAKLLAEIADYAHPDHAAGETPPQEPLGQAWRLWAHDSPNTSSRPRHKLVSAFRECRSAFTPAAVTLNRRCGIPPRSPSERAFFQVT